MSFKDKITHLKGGKHNFHIAHMDSILYFYHQEYHMIFAATKLHCEPPVGCSQRDSALYKCIYYYY